MMPRVLTKIGSMSRQVVPGFKFAWARATGAKFPAMVTLSLTDRCNFRCEYCNLPHLDRDEMSTEEWLRAIDELADAGMMRVSLMGGEPLVRKDIGVFIDRLKARGVNVAMNTNGWLVPRRMSDVEKLDLVCVTLDGPPAVHDVQRHKGSQKRALTAIELMRSRGMNVVTMTVLTARAVQQHDTKSNNDFETVDYVLEKARELGVRSFFQLVHDADGDPNKDIGAGISDEGINAVARHLMRRKDEGWPVGPSRTYLRALAGEGGAGVRRLHSCDDCYASRYSLAITPKGEVVACPLTFREDAPSGRQLGYLQAFEALAQPRAAGCACYPLQEMNYILDGTPEVIANALGTAVGHLVTPQPRPPAPAESDLAEPVETGHAYVEKQLRRLPLVQNAPRSP
ncbi:MAG: radical SAM protein [Polyangiaceae bacterium]